MITVRTNLVTSCVNSLMGVKPMAVCQGLTRFQIRGIRKSYFKACTNVNFYHDKSLVP